MKFYLHLCIYLENKQNVYLSAMRNKNTWCRTINRIELYDTLTTLRIKANKSVLGDVHKRRHQSGGGGF